MPKADSVARSLNNREISTLLCALRFFQRKRPESDQEILELFDKPGMPLEDDQIDRLCEDLNCAKEVQVQ